MLPRIADSDSDIDCAPFDLTVAAVDAREEAELLGSSHLLETKSDKGLTGKGLSAETSKEIQGPHSPKECRKGEKRKNSSEELDNDISHQVEKSPQSKKTWRRSGHFLKDSNKSKKISNGEPFYKGCEYRCKTCSNVLGSVEAIRNHLRKSHKFSQNNYRENYDMIREEHFDCVICGANMLRDYLVIKTHVKAKHKMGMVEYARDYVNPCLGIE